MDFSRLKDYMDKMVTEYKVPGVDCVVYKEHEMLVRCLEDGRTDEINALVAMHIYEGFRQYNDIMKQYPEYFKKEAI